MLNADYTAGFFSGIHQGSEDSAREMVPWLVDLLRPTSVVDVGCGLGIWLKVLHENGVGKILGLDAPWVPVDKLKIPAEKFVQADLAHLDTVAVDSFGRFDLALSLEVAEHIPAEHAKAFVAMLTDLAPCVLFSAAIPDQGGIGHVNERWPQDWMSTFREFNYVCIDCVRGRFWDDDKVAPWYAQNAFFFVEEQAANRYELLREAEAKYSFGRRSVIHPKQYARKIAELRDPNTWSIREVIRVAPSRFKQAFKHRLFGAPVED